MTCQYVAQFSLASVLHYLNRQDGVFLHGARFNTQPCDDLAGSQLWRSSGTTGVASETWRCITQAAGGYCNPSTARTCYHQADKPVECTAMPMFLKPGNHYSHMLRLQDGQMSALPMLTFLPSRVSALECRAASRMHAGEVSFQ